METQFNLIDEAWLPCVRLDGKPVQVGLFEALAQAHALRELQGENPLATAALHRLLLAILHRNFGPQDAEAWFALWQAGRWDAGVLRTYFDRWRERFYLFDDHYPFYQSVDAKSSAEPPTRLSLTHAYNSTLFEHEAGGDSFAVPAARAAQWIVTMQASGIGMGPPHHPHPAGPLVNSLLVLVQGRTLFETLAFNLLAYDPQEGKPTPHSEHGPDLPTWEYDVNPFQPDPKRFYLPGYLGYLTFQVRTIRLYPTVEDGELVVRECTIAQGARWDNRAIEDPMKTYLALKKKESGWIPYRLKEDRALWRDTGALFRIRGRDTADAAYRPPRAFEWLAHHVEWGYLRKEQIFDYLALGLCNSNARLDFFRQERMPLPLAYFAEDNAALEEQLRTGLQAAEDIASALVKAGRELSRWVASPAGQAKWTDPGAKMVYDRLNLEQYYWPRLEIAFREFVCALPHGPEDARAAWLQHVMRTARQAFDEAVRAVDDPLRGLKAATRARGTLEYGLAKALPELRAEPAA